MGTIITVHGTAATGPEQGERWWQKGSPFESHLRELVESDDGELKFKPIIWDGANSENSRRNAGRRLLGAFREVEGRGEDYCVIGHSHGGSVIAAALFYAARKRQELARLRSWMTVGTPFLVPQKRRFLFNRINFWEKSGYVVILTMCVLVAFMMSGVPEARSLLSKGTGSVLEIAEMVAAILIVGLVAFGPAILLLLALSVRNSRRRFTGKKRIAKRFSQYFGARWHSFFHENDEAIRGLGLAQKVEFPIFRGLFLLPQISLLVLILLPITILAAASSESAMLGLFDYMSPRMPDFILAAPDLFLENGELRGQGGNVAVNAALIVVTPLFVLSQLGFDWLVFGPVGTIAGSTASATLLALLAPLALGILAVAFYIPSMVVVLTVILLGALVSLGMSRILDGLTWRQLRASAFGDDNRAEAILGANVHPFWLGEGAPALPDELSKEISAFSDEKAGLAIGRLRSALNTLAFAEGGHQRSDMLSEYLTWDELIHTSYFQVPRFRKLLAYAISRSEGFRATQTFMADPDYKLVAKWFEALRAGKEPTA